MKNRLVCLFAVGLISFGSLGCYHYRAIAREPITPETIGGSVGAATEYEGQVVIAWAWGLAQQEPQIDNCMGQDLYEVKMTTNLGYMLITVVTLGIVAPVKIEWKCAKPRPTEGVLGAATRGESDAD